MNAPEEANFDLFRDILSTPLIAKSTPSPTKVKKARGKKTSTKDFKPIASKSVTGNGSSSTAIESQDDAAELGEFIDYIAHEIFTSFPLSLRTLSYTAYINTSSIRTTYDSPLSKTTLQSILAPLPPSITDTLTTYSILKPHQTLSEFLIPLLQTYVTTLTTAPPPPASTKDLATSCEICQREHIPLTYHHLIPRSVHAKVLKRGWHTEDQLNNVAWLCRACHSFVHSCSPNEELAREWFSVERLVEREDVQAFAKWVGGVRWKKR